MKRWLKRFAVLFLFCLFGVGVTGAWISWMAHTRLPQLDGEIRYADLTGAVSVIRDEWGVPHIEAKTAEDAYFALGYVMGQDRLFQMELLRRLAGGELAEIFGPPAVAIDRVARSFCLRSKAEETWQILKRESPEVATIAEAFCAGLNERQNREPLPFEHVVLQIPKHVYTPIDTLLVAAILPVSFADALRVDPLAAMLSERCPDRPIADLFPGYDFEESPTTIIEGNEGTSEWGAPAAMCGLRKN